jgi:broad specificity phosphatase PhoE
MGLEEKELKMQTTLYLTRHGETEWNVERRMQGHKNSPLTSLGGSQANWLGDSLKGTHIDVIYSSSSQRTIETAQIIRGQREIELIHSDDLREIYMGLWEGEVTAAIEQSDPKGFNNFWKNPDKYKPTNHGESCYYLQKRVLPFVKRVIEEHGRKTILIVTHAATLKILMAYFENRSLEQLWDPPHINPTSLSKVVIEEGISSIKLHGDVSHYQETKK